ncbi:MAG: redox-regulated ATPase YchF, partial [Acidobacteria bacterium]|nr:redox-regulated ATPase YchF [Acidobacteriota bacterium]
MRKIGIIGLPQAGKSSLFQVLTRRKADVSGAGKPEARLGVVEVPDVRLTRLAEIFQPKKNVPTQLEFVDIQGNINEVTRGGTQLSVLREVDGLAHVVRAFRDENIPHSSGSVNPKRDIENVELELILSDLLLIEKRLERLERDIKKIKNPALEAEQTLLIRLREALEKETPLREITLEEREEHRVRGFTFLSAKPELLVLNLGDEEAGEMEEAETRYELADLKHRTGTAVTAFCGKIEAELAELSDTEAAELMADFGLKESGVARAIRACYDLMNLITFFTAGGEEQRAWSVPRGTTALKAAGTVHTDMEKGFIRAEVVGFDDLMDAGSLAEARSRGTMRLEGKTYQV